MPQHVDAHTVKRWLSDEAELAFLDVREAGQYGEGHPFHATFVPYSKFEPEIVRLVPNPGVRIVLLDEGDGVAERAATAAESLGYTNLHVLRGGAPAWREAGYTLFKGVNVPSKTFGEILEHARNTPRISAEEVEKLRHSGERFVIVDGRPFTEYARMNIPGGICCPNGELALRIDEIVPDPETRIIVNCAGRTRSILGAETLLALGLPNKVQALENGTQGWFLAGLELERGANRRHSLDLPKGRKIAERAQHLRQLAESRGAKLISSRELARLMDDEVRTTFLLDVRTPEEFASGSAPGFQNAPGGQLVQATDQWVGVMRARIVLADNDGVRAPMIAQWLAQLGHDVSVLDGGIAEVRSTSWKRPSPVWNGVPPLTVAADAVAPGSVIVDVRSSAEYRRSHVRDAVWTIRPMIPSLAARVAGKPVVLIAGDDETATLAAGELVTAGAVSVNRLAGAPSSWEAAGLGLATTTDSPPDAERIDYLFFVHDRHEGNTEAARGYIAWEMGLVDQLDAAERGVFRIAH